MIDAVVAKRPSLLTPRAAAARPSSCRRSSQQHPQIGVRRYTYANRLRLKLSVLRMMADSSPTSLTAAAEAAVAIDCGDTSLAITPPAADDGREQREQAASLREREADGRRCARIGGHVSWCRR